MLQYSLSASREFNLTFMDFIPNVPNCKASLTFTSASPPNSIPSGVSAIDTPISPASFMSNLLASALDTGVG